VLKYAPCKKSTWQIVDRLLTKLQVRYWTEVSPSWLRDDEHELRELVAQLLLVKRPKAAFAAVRFHIRKLDSPTLLRLMKAIATTSSDSDASVRFSSYEIARAFEVLDNRADVSRDDLAQLEFLYFRRWSMKNAVSPIWSARSLRRRCCSCRPWD
jgi:hypothetical protein